MDDGHRGDAFNGCHQKDNVAPENDQNISLSYQNGNYMPVKNRKGSKNPGAALRECSIKVCEKVQRKGKTTHNEVADEIIAEFAAGMMKVSLNESDEKNIRRRVYDALNVLVAVGIIAKYRKEIWWEGPPNSKARDMEELKVLHANLMTRIGKQLAYLKDLEIQFADLQNLIQRNQHLFQSEHVPCRGLSLPFIVVETTGQTTVEIEISDNRQLVDFDFDSTPFSLHDDAYILKLMRCYQL